MLLIYIIFWYTSILMNTKKKRWIKNINPSHLFLWGYEYAKLYKELDEGKGKLKSQKTIAERVKLIPIKRKAKKKSDDTTKKRFSITNTITSSWRRREICSNTSHSTAISKTRKRVSTKKFRNPKQTINQTSAFTSANKSWK